MAEAAQRREAITEQNKYEGDWIKLLIVLVVAIGGGTVRLLLGPLGTREAIFAVLGGLLVMGSIGAVLILDARIRRRLQRLMEDL